MYSFLKKETFGLREQVTFIGNELKIYLPVNYLEKDSVFARQLGSKIETLGLFWFSTGGKFYELTCPVKILFEFQEKESFKGKLVPSLPNLEYDVFVLKNGDAFCYDTMHKQGIADMELMLLRVIDMGKMPPTVSYDESIAIMTDLLISTGMKGRLGVCATLLEVLLSEMYRNKHNPNEPFRKLITSHPGTTPYDFKLIRMNRLSGLNSVFGALMGEDTTQQFTNAIVRTREHQKDRPSIVEKLLKY